MSPKEKEKRKVGRPSKYNEEILKKSREYIASCVDGVEKVYAGIDKNGKKKFIEKFRVHFPTAEGLARYLGISRSILYDWADEYEEISDILETINQEQVKRLIDNGLSGDYNATIAKLVLAKHGYKDNQEISGSIGVNIKGNEIKIKSYG